MFNILKCKHDPNNENNTLVFVTEKTFLTFPQTYHCCCKHCKKAFVFIKDEEGKFKKA
jgi:hypothetical protein